MDQIEIIDKDKHNKLEIFYEEYKKKIINDTHENLTKKFKDNLMRLNENEIRVARLAKFDPKSIEMNEVANVYLSTAKNVPYSYIKF